MKHEARVFRSLADETRLSILCLLMQHEELCVCDFMEVLGITQSKASRHLRYLYNTGWVSDRREGLKIKYRLCTHSDTMKEKQLQTLAEVMNSHPIAQSLKGKLCHWLERKPKTGDGKEDGQTGVRT
jgi:ArsR family transcriptional regulator|uniref:Metalloregulator ArsR/SmtB family transcription factor n=1 Tax=Desulfobacca acetoxidans TaxID=60893 RepID=A0A7V6DP58_9BACT